MGRFQGMMRPVWRFSARLAALYVLVELAALALLTWAFGLGWTLLVLFVTFLAGMVLAGSQLRGQRAALRRAGTDPRSAITEGVLVGLGAFLVFIQGLVTTAAGALMLAPPTRGRCGQWPTHCSLVESIDDWRRRTFPPSADAEPVEVTTSTGRSLTGRSLTGRSSTGRSSTDPTSPPLADPSHLPGDHTSVQRTRLQPVAPRCHRDRGARWRGRLAGR